jgi:hypothetical protein
LPFILDLVQFFMDPACEVRDRVLSRAQTLAARYGCEAADETLAARYGCEAADDWKAVVQRVVDNDARMTILSTRQGGQKRFDFSHVTRAFSNTGTGRVSHSHPGGS